jgi:hypothetical protein
VTPTDHGWPDYDKPVPPAESVRSVNLKPGDRLRHSSGSVVTIRRRKSADDDHHGLSFRPGWWLVEGGGLADFVFDDSPGEWTLIDGPEEA